MSVLYTLIARSNKVILTEYTDCSGNFQQIAMLILKKIEPEISGLIEYNE